MQQQRGFTLIEIMVVVVIMAILAAIVVPKIVSRPDEAKMVKAKQDVLAIENAMELYKLDNGFYPSTDQGIQALATKPDSDPSPQNWRGYLNHVPQDPWGHEYHYLNPGKNGAIDIFTYGADNQPGGEGINADIGNWDSEQKPATNANQ